MGTRQPWGPRAGAVPQALLRGVDWLTARVLVAYLAVAAGQWLWTILNTDVRQLLR